MVYPVMPLLVTGIALRVWLIVRAVWNLWRGPGRGLRSRTFGTNRYFDFVRSVRARSIKLPVDGQPLHRQASDTSDKAA
jgi:hypothetical protein